MITVEQDGGVWRLRSYGEPCGTRLLKSEPFPLRRDRPFDYDTKHEASEAATKLEAYLSKQHTTKNDRRRNSAN